MFIFQWAVTQNASMVEVAVQECAQGNFMASYYSAHNISASDELFTQQTCQITDITVTPDNKNGNILVHLLSN
jgi:hypothetical protein